MKHTLLGIILFLLFSNQAYAKDEINWMVVNWPPWMILEGEDAGQGRFNKILHVAQENLPEYDHVTEEMNWARFWYEAETNTNVCNIFALKTTERENIVYFSAPHSFALPNAIIMRKSDKEKLGNPDSYSLIKLLHDKRFTGGAEKRRSYTEKLDTILKNHEPGSNLSRFGYNSESLTKMVRAGRIDYTIEYPIVAAYHSKNLGTNPDPIVSIPIAEMDPIAYVYLACTKNEWGKKVIEQWNEALRRLKPTQEYRRMTEMGHIDDRELKIFKNHYDAFSKSN